MAQNSMDDAPKGSVITFYSFKGGVGRTLAVANTALRFARKGHRVVIVDFDLESPGLHAFFHPSAGSSEGDSNPDDSERGRSDPDRRVPGSQQDGLLEFLEKCYELPEDEPRIESHLWKVTHPKLGPRHRGSIQLLSAGRFDADYAQRLHAFDWTTFYEERHGHAFLELLRRRLLELADVVLIDSRTGVTDIAAICTFQLPDILVILFGLHRQGIEGAREIARGIQKEHGSNPDSRLKKILLLPARVDETGEEDKLNLWIARARAELSTLDADTTELLWEVDQRIPYVSKMAYGEPILAPDNSSILNTAYRNLVETLQSHMTKPSDVAAPTLSTIRKACGDLEDLVHSLPDLDERGGDASPPIELSFSRLETQWLRTLSELRAIREDFKALFEPMPEKAPDFLKKEPILTSDLFSPAKARHHVKEIKDELSRIEKKVSSIQEKWDARTRRLKKLGCQLDDTRIRDLKKDVQEYFRIETAQKEFDEYCRRVKRTSLDSRLRACTLEISSLENHFGQDTKAIERWLEERLDHALENFSLEEPAPLGEVESKSGQDDRFLDQLIHLLSLLLSHGRRHTQKHWTAYDLIATEYKSGDKAREAFEKAGVHLWKSHWNALLGEGEARDGIVDAADLLTSDIREQFIHLQESPSFPEMEDLWDSVNASLVRILTSDDNRHKERIERAIETHWFDPRFEKTIAGLEKNDALPQEEITWVSALWLKKGSWSKDIFQVFVRTLIRRGFLTEALYALAAETHDHPRKEQDEMSDKRLGAICVSRMFFEASRGGEFTSIEEALDNTSLQFFLLDSDLGIALLVQIAGDLGHLVSMEHPLDSELMRDLRSKLMGQHRDEIVKLGGRKTVTWLEKIAQSPSRHRIARRARAIRREIETKTIQIHAHWGYHREYERRLQALAMDRLNEVWRGSDPLDELSDRIDSIDGSAWINETVRKLKEKGNKDSTPNGPARTSINRYLETLKGQLQKLLNLRKEGGAPLDELDQWEQERLDCTHEWRTFWRSLDNDTRNLLTQPWWLEKEPHP